MVFYSVKSSPYSRKKHVNFPFEGGTQGDGLIINVALNYRI